jgi:hypothetical protein
MQRRQVRNRLIWFQLLSQALKPYSENEKILSFLRIWGRLKFSISPRISAPSNQFFKWIATQQFLSYRLVEFAMCFAVKSCSSDPSSPNYETAGHKIFTATMPTLHNIQRKHITINFYEDMESKPTFLCAVFSTSELCRAIILIVCGNFALCCTNIHAKTTRPKSIN